MEWKYCINRIDNTIRGQGYLVGEPADPDLYYTSEIPEGAVEYVPPPTPKPKREQIQDIWKMFPIEVRAQIAPIAATIDSALAVNDLELAVYLVNTIPAGDYPQIREAVLQILNS
jgi:hypothetical protein